MPVYTNPAEFLLELTNSDFAHADDQTHVRVESLCSGWQNSEATQAIKAAILATTKGTENPGHLVESKSRSTFSDVVVALLHRSFIKSYRDVVAYGIRFAMYIGQFSRNLSFQTTLKGSQALLS